MADDHALVQSIAGALGMSEDTEIPVRDFEAPVEFIDGVGDQDIATQAQDDYAYVRATLQHLIDTGQKALEGALDTAFASHHPRSYEVVGAILKQIADVTARLIKLRKEYNIPGTKEPEITPGDVTNNYVFNGTTAQLNDMIQGVMTDAQDALIIDGQVCVVHEK